MKDWYLLALAILTIVLFVLFGNADDAYLQQKQYCENVYNKTWPDFKNTFEKECKREIKKLTTESN